MNKIMPEGSFVSAEDVIDLIRATSTTVGKEFARPAYSTAIDAAVPMGEITRLRLLVSPATIPE